MNTWRLNNILLNNQEFTEEIKEEILKFIKTNDNENTIQNLREVAKAVLRGSLQQLNPTSRNKKDCKQPNLTPKATRERTTKPKVSRRKKKSQKSEQKYMKQK